ncbi:transposase [Halobacterium salinarum]|uniref:transposase n=2 Tax=Halobacterium salinarum TaxID=2242 RepID=UPI002553B1F0|nr:transposase [Halobacterium salinarum]MDL0133718.1 transposase [Halobacterium salinarum]
MGFERDDLYGGDPPQYPDGVDPHPDPIDPYTPTPTYDVDRWEEKNQRVELGGDAEYDEDTEKMLWALRHFDLRIAPDCDEIDDWDALDRRTQRMYRAGVLKEFVGGYRELQEILEKGGPVAREAGFTPGDGTHYSTLSTAISEFDADFLSEAAEYSHNAALYALTPQGSSFDRAPTYPSKPRAYYRETDEDWTVSIDRKMSEASRVVAEYMALAAPSLRFDRDRLSPNYQYSIGDIYRLLAHLAIEQCAAKNGAELLAWQSDRDTPSSSTLFEYIPNAGTDGNYEVEDIEAKFINATCRLLERETLAPSEPIHLAYDLTTVGWYGKENRWVTGSINDDNTTEFWHYAVLSTVSPGRNYILGATPLKERSEKGEALDRMLQQLRENADPEFGRIYMDSQLFEADIVTTCREHGLNWMIQAPDKGMYTELAENASSEEPTKQEDITFTDFDASHRTFNAIIWPIPDKEVGQEETTPATDLTRYHDRTETSTGISSSETGPDSNAQSRLDRHGNLPPVAETTDAGSGESDAHTIWITDMDVGERDLEGLGYQYRHRWKIETAIRQLKHTFQGQCRSSDRLRRAVYFGAAQLFFNFWVALNHELPYRLGDPSNFRLTGLETLHALREADFEAGKQGNNIFI